MSSPSWPPVFLISIKNEWCHRSRVAQKTGGGRGRCLALPHIHGGNKAGRKRVCWADKWASGTAFSQRIEGVSTMPALIYNASKETDEASSTLPPFSERRLQTVKRTVRHKHTRHSPREPDDIRLPEAEHSFRGTPLRATLSINWPGDHNETTFSALSRVCTSGVNFGLSLYGRHLLPK